LTIINHARTLLLNRSRDQLAGTWDQYVDPLFIQQELPPHLTSVWTILFGAEPDREMLNWRANQYMQILHSSEYAAYVTELDSRISYRIPTKLDADELPVVTVEASNGDASTISVIGTPRDDPVAGRLSRHMLIRKESSTSASYVDLRTGQGDTVTIGPAHSPLTPSGLSFLINGGSTNDTWEVSTMSAPSRGMIDIVRSLEAVSSSYMLTLFRPSLGDPYYSFYRLWSDSRGFTLRLTGLLLAWIYQAEKLRNG
jgi:hypothetical protein